MTYCGWCWGTSAVLVGYELIELCPESVGSGLLCNVGAVISSSPLQLQRLFHVTSKRLQLVTASFYGPSVPFTGTGAELVAHVTVLLPTGNKFHSLATH